MIENIDALAEQITARHEAEHPEVFERYGGFGRKRCREDAAFHLSYLDAALEAESEQVFLDYVAWGKVMLAARRVPPEDLADNLRIIDEVLAHEGASKLIRAAIEALPAMPDDIPSFLDPDYTLAHDYLADVLQGRRREASTRIMDALTHGVSPRDIYRRVFEPVQHEIGRLWQLNRISVAQEHLCTASTQQIMTQIYSRIFDKVSEGRRAVAMCVGGEMHEIGLRVVTDLLELEGWRTLYLGANVPPQAAVQLCADREADVVLVSATLPPHVKAAAEVVRLIRADQRLRDAKVIVGGRAFLSERELWRRIGADAYAANADECLAVIDRMA